MKTKHGLNVFFAACLLGGATLNSFAKTKIKPCDVSGSLTNSCQICIAYCSLFLHQNNPNATLDYTVSYVRCLSNACGGSALKPSVQEIRPSSG